ncbi:MAG: ABC transporter permease, partial [bacterium]|nr:ABC transporter permease [bacterium]
EYELEVIEEWTVEEPLPNSGLRIDLPPRLGEVLLTGTEATVTIWASSGSMDAIRLEVLVQKALAELRAGAFSHLVRGNSLTVEMLGVPVDVVPVVVDASDWGVRREVPSGMKQSVPGNMVMFVLMSVLVTGAIRLLQDREQGHLQRLLAYPVAAGGVVAAQFISLLVIGIAEALYFLLLGRVIFGQTLGPAPWAVVGIMILLVAAVSGVGVLLGSTLKSAKQAAAVGLLLTLSMSALGGCWWPMEILPDGMKMAALTLPTGQTIHALIRLMVWEDAASAVLPNALYLAVFALVSCTLAASVLRRRLV